MTHSRSQQQNQQTAQNQLQTSLRSLLADYETYIREQCASLGLPDSLLNMHEHIGELLHASPDQLHLFADPSGKIEGFCTVELINLPQANNITVANIDNVFLLKSPSPQSGATFRDSLANHCRQIIQKLPSTASSVSLVTLSTDLDKKAAYESLGAGTNPFCTYPILDRSKAKLVKGCEGIPRRCSTAGAATPEAAREIAAVVYEYRLRRTKEAPEQWPPPKPEHLDGHVQYIHERLLGRPDIPSTIVEYEGAVVAAGIGFATPVKLNLSSSAPLSLRKDAHALILDDFYVRLDKDWNRFGPTLFADIIDQISDNTIQYVQFVQNAIDYESKHFSEAIEAKPCLEFYNIPLSRCSS